MKRFVLGAALLLTPNLVNAASQTPGSSTALLFLPYNFALFHTAPAYVHACVDQGYGVIIMSQDTAGTSPSVGLDDFLDYLGDGYGCFYVDTHGGSGGLGVEAYELTSAGEQARNAAHDAYIAGGLVGAGEIYESASMHGYHISIRPEAIASRYVSANSIVFNQACRGQEYEDVAWPGSRCRLGTYTSWAGMAESWTFWNRMNGLEGISRRSVSGARYGLPVALAGAGNTTLSPAVSEFSHAAETVIPDYGVLDVWWELDTVVDTTVDAGATLDASPDHFTLFDETWENGNRLRACVQGNEPGCESIFLLANAVRSATNPQSTLDGDGIGPAGDDFEVILCVDDNPAASVWGFSVTPGRAAWRVGVERNTAAYAIEESASAEGPWEPTGIPDPPGRGHHQVEIAGTPTSWYRLVEVETNGKRLIHAVDRAVPFGSRHPALPPSEDELRHHIEEKLAEERQNPPSEAWSSGEKYVIFAPAAFSEHLVSLAEYWSLRGYDPEIIDIDDFWEGPPGENPGLFRASLLAAILTRAQQGTRYFHLVGDWNDWHEVHGSDWEDYWTGWWTPFRQDHIDSYPPTTADLILPTFTIPDSLPHLVGLGHDAPYVFTDQPFADTDGDGSPDIVVGRWPVTEGWEVAQLVSKVMEYNSNRLPSPYGVTLFVYDWSGSPGSGGRVRVDADAIEALVPPQHELQRLQAFPLACDDLNTAAINQWNSHLNDVAIILGTQSDEFEPGRFFDRTCGAHSFTIDDLDNDHAVVVLAGTCDTGCWAYGDGADTSGTYATPACKDFLVLGNSNEGAIAWVGPTGASWQSGNSIILESLVQETFADTDRSLADSWTAALQDIYAEHAGDSTVTKLARSYVFLGDPLTRLSAGLSPPTAATLPADIPAEPLLLPNGPNPFRDGTRIRFSLPRKAPIEVRIYDVRGRLVRTLVSDLLPAGRHEIVWTGLNDNGRRVAAGVYYCRLRTEGATFTRKLVALE